MFDVGGEAASALSFPKKERAAGWPFETLSEGSILESVRWQTGIDLPQLPVQPADRADSYRPEYQPLNPKTPKPTPMKLYPTFAIAAAAALAFAACEKKDATVEQKADDAKATVEQKAGEAKADASAKIDDAKATAKEKAPEAAATIDKAAAEAKDAAAKAVDATKDAGTKAVEATKDSADKAADAVKDAAKAPAPDAAPAPAPAPDAPKPQ